MYEKLGETAYLLSEELGFEAALAQEAYREMADQDEDTPSFHYFQGSARERFENAEELYQEAVAVLGLAHNLGLGDPEEERDEEVRLEKEKWNEGLKHDYSGDIGDAMDAHLENQHEARNQEILSHATPYHELRNVVDQYERLARSVEDQRPEFLELDYDEDGDQVEIVESGEMEDDPVDLSEQFFSKRI